VSPVSATGTVQLLDGGTVIGTATVASGAASFSTSSLARGVHSLTAVYSGDASDTAATSGVFTQTEQTAASISLTSSPNPSNAGQAVSLSATVSPSTATGTLQFLDGATVLSTITLSSGHGAFPTSQRAGGAHSLTAVYGGDSSDTAATSAVITQTVHVPLPAAPSSLTATASGTSQINLRWNASATSCVTYDVYSSTSNGFAPGAANRLATGVTTTTFSATGLNASTAYYFRVTAVNSGGESSATNQATATTAGSVGCHVIYSVSSSWNNGFGGVFSIQNTGSSPLNSWVLTWSWPGSQKVTQSWNSTYSQTGGNLTFTHMSYNSTIAAGTTLTGMGFNASFKRRNPGDAVCILRKWDSV
jgi:hypothetical protein